MILESGKKYKNKKAKVYAPHKNLIEELSRAEPLTFKGGEHMHRKAAARSFRNETSALSR